MNCDFINRDYMENVYKKISKTFTDEREKNNITVAMLEKYSGIDRTAIYKMESNKRRFGFENLIKMCYVLNLKLDDLYYVDDGNEYRTKVRLALKDLPEEKCIRVYNYILNISDCKAKGVENIEIKKR